MRKVLGTWSLRPTVEALMCLRGVAMITAMTVLAELGDLTRFDTPRQLVGFLGHAPSEHSSGSRHPSGCLSRKYVPEITSTVIIQESVTGSRGMSGR